jgi:hypothetical protein
MKTLADIAHARSGDKGNHANIAIIAHQESHYPWLRDFLTVERVARWFAGMAPSRIVRFEAQNLHALNFVLHDVLAGGASQSLRIDTQGKTLGLALLRMPLDELQVTP